MQPELTTETVAIATVLPLTIYTVGGLIVNGQLFRLLKRELPALWRELGEPQPLRGVKDPQATAKLRSFIARGSLPEGASKQLKEAHVAAKLLARALPLLMLYVLSMMFMFVVE